MFQVSACAWSLATTPAQSLDRVRLAGFQAADIRPDCWDGLDGPDELAGRGLALGCAGLLPMAMAPGVSLNAIATEDAGRVLTRLYGAVERAALFGATRAYVTSPEAPSADRGRYVLSMRQLADHAAGLGVRLCIEPTPGRALPDDASALEFVREAEHENLFVLLDFGHCLITGENPSQSIRNAGDRLGYVHVDDNGGQADDHYALFDGVLKSSVIESFLDTLAASDYDGGIGLEFKSNILSPMSALVAARDYILAWERRHAA